MRELINTLSREIGDFSKTSAIPSKVIDSEGTVFCAEGNPRECELCRAAGCPETECRKTHIKSGEETMRFGGKYIYLCPMGFVHAASPVLLDKSKIVTIIAGPMLIIDKKDYFDEYIGGKADISEDKKKKLKNILDGIHNVSLEKVTSVSNMLYCLASYSSGREAIKLISTEENLEQQSEISDSIIKLKGGVTDASSYPIYKEKELLDVLSGGDRKTAQKLLNEILGFIFFSTGGNIDIIKTRVVELIVQLSRTAILNGGVSQQKVLEMCVDYMKTIWKLETIDDISAWMSRIMSSLTQMIFSSKDIKHIDVIQKVVAFINLNYMHKLSLEDIAGEVYLSSSYLSKIFKAEMKINLSTYLNNIRIEKSKLYLLDASINIVDVAAMVGFEEQSYFSKVFKNVAGVSPGKYRQLKGHIK